MQRFFMKAENIVGAFSHVEQAGFSEGAKEILTLMIAEALQKAAWEAQQPNAPSVIHPKS
jgi:hypothetical protein